MTRHFIPVLAALLMLSGSASAQTAQPYAGLEKRPVKALSEQQLGDLRAGRGMGLALAAELNGYPGPVHVLELADKLELSAAQRAQVQSLFAAMKAQAVPLGETLIAQETTLDRAFADKSITHSALTQQLTAIGATQSALRTAHLKYHLDTLAALTPVQVARYNELRGYASGGQAPAGHQHRQHFN